MKDRKVLKIIVTVAVAIAIAGAAFFAGFITSRLTRSRQAASFDWAIKTIRENYYQDIPADDILSGTLKDVADKYLDIYSDYYTAEEYKAVTASNRGSKSGVGISYAYVPDGAHPSGKSGILIESVVGNSPAYRSGLRAGEFVTAVERGSQTTQITSSDGFSACIDSLADGEKFTLVTDRGERELAKSEYTASYCAMYTSTAHWSVFYDSDGSGVKKTDGGIDYLPDGAAYLRLDQFYGGAAWEMASLIEIFNAQECKSLILDLRGNGGGYVDVMCDIAGIYTGQLPERNKIGMIAVYKDGRKEGYSVKVKYSRTSQLHAGTKVRVLADNGTASASEALIGVLIDNGVIDYGDIYISDFSEKYLAFSKTADKNCRTYGKGIMQTTFPNPLTGEALKLTTAKIYWPKGEVSIHDVGLNVGQGCKTVEAEWDVTYGDEQLEKAVKAIYAN
ncbi:MAG: hypothetical protein K2H78_03430 [Clostridia bacterium]|nr:hypothetical protein [Clostridia bacterium]